ncbi:hypothetical protein PHYPSEUDO_011787 [Phytophthora pseudosyringae]|uniref:Phytotoxin PcF domain-containing protein n=1 Tax=Phytophthora pseudosyringae TaxID=221518 RepID=A0A8T1W7S5_9STRA|nr:hypothetical protein PHYPSEUDO_011787 [Phytophthora pseudosyringae]
MNFKTCFAIALAAVVATVVSAEDPLYCQATGCPTLYSEANLAVSKDCRDEGLIGDAFHGCCEKKCGATNLSFLSDYRNNDQCPDTCFCLAIIADALLTPSPPLAKMDGVRREAPQPPGVLTEGGRSDEAPARGVRCMVSYLPNLERKDEIRAAPS